MKSRNKELKNIRPAKIICEKCESHGFCLAEDGLPNYQCPKIVHPEYGKEK